jgi:predicted MFS family arabinose efflux permease
MSRPRSAAQDHGRGAAFHFIVLLGIVSMFGDVTYEGARSITGPYMAVLGAGAGVVGLVSGFGEFVGYALRLASGYIADRTRAYWVLTFLGYGLVLSIPLLAFAGTWQVAAVLIVLERMGKAVRTPARDTILSHATKRVGRGLGFGLHEALDQVGAVVGPLIFTAVFLLEGSYRQGFNILWAPAVLAVVALAIARRRVPAPEKLEEADGGTASAGTGLPRVFWPYVVFICLSIAGYANFQLISFHFKVQSVLSDAQIPLFYVIAMAADMVVAPLIGKVYDRAGLSSLAAIPVLSIPLPFLVFSRGFAPVVAGVVLWGAIMGIHETIMRAAIADISPVERRGSAYGIFNTAYGAAWFLGSTAMGFLYEISVNYLIVFAVAAEVLSIGAFLYLRGAIRAARGGQ